MRRATRWAFAASLAVAIASCGEDSRGADAGRDAQAHVVDAGPPADGGTSGDAGAEPDAGPRPECVSDEDCATLLCVEGSCTTTCRDDCDCALGKRCADGGYTVPICIEGEGSCSPASPACPSPTLANRGFRDNLNLDMNDWALFLDDALLPGCEAAAAEGLRAKLEATLAVTTHVDPLGRTVGPFQGWLEGAHVAFVFSTAAVLGARGELDASLDALLVRARDQYVDNPVYVGLDPNCGLSGGRWAGGNGCMDDFTVGAPAYAWTAAFERLRRRPHATHVSATEDLLARAFGPESFCAHDPTAPMIASDRGPCNSTIAAVGAGEAEAVSLNHGTQNVAYGLGLMTLVGWAATGLEVAGAGHAVGADERIAAEALMREGQRATPSDGSAYRTDCYRFVAAADGGVAIHRDADCGDAYLHYLPQMFHVAPLYERYYSPPPVTVDDGGVARGAFLYDVFDATLFSDSPEVFFGPGRRLAYGTVGAAWLVARPPMSGLLSD